MEISSIYMYGRVKGVEEMVVSYAAVRIRHTIVCIIVCVCVCKIMHTLCNNRVILSKTMAVPILFDNIRDNVKVEKTGFYVSSLAASGTPPRCITLTGLPYFR